MKMYNLEHFLIHGPDRKEDQVIGQQASDAEDAVCARLLTA